MIFDGISELGFFLHSKPSLGMSGKLLGSFDIQSLQMSIQELSIAGLIKKMLTDILPFEI